MRGLNPPLADAGRRRQLKRLAALGVLAASGLPAAFAANDKARKARIVCVGGALTEIAFALGAGGDLVGVDTTSIHPEAARQLPSVGYARALSTEGVLALAPTQIIGTEEAGPPAVLRQLSAAGIPLTVLPSQHSFEGMVERVNRMGALLGRSAQAAQLAGTLQADWARVRQKVAARKAAPRVLFVLSHSPNQVMVAGAGTGAEAMLQLAQARNAVEGFQGYKPITPEAVIAAQPDVVLFTDQGLAAIGGVDGALRLPGIARTPAGLKRRFVSLDAVFLLGFGPRMGAAVSALDDALTHALKA